MPVPTLTEVFGAGTTQDANSITIPKANLPGLTPLANNSAGSLAAGIVRKLQESLPQSTFDTNVDQSVYVTTGFPTFVSRGEDNTQYRVDQLTVNFAKVDNGATIDPDSY